jgi:hypothetical protein
MSDDELWRIFKDVAETLTERMDTEKHELESRLAHLEGLTTVMGADETTNRRSYTH